MAGTLLAGAVVAVSSSVGAGLPLPTEAGLIHPGEFKTFVTGESVAAICIYESKSLKRWAQCTMHSEDFNLDDPDASRIDIDRILPDSSESNGCCIVRKRTRDKKVIVGLFLPSEETKPKAFVAGSSL